MNKNAAGKADSKIHDNGGSRSAKRRPKWTVFGLLPAIVAGFVVLAAGLIARPPAYVARATFAVDWNEMASVFGDEDAEKVRAVLRKGIVEETKALPQSDDLPNMLDPDGTLSKGQRAALTAKVRKSLHLTLAGQTQDRDSFAIEFRASDPVEVVTVVKCILRGQLSDLNSQAFVMSLVGVARSKSNLNDIQEQQARDHGETADGSSSASDLQEIAAGLSLAKNLIGLSLKPAKVVEDVHVENRIGRHVVRVLFAAAFFGVLAGVAGLTWRNFVLTPKTRRPTTDAIASGVPPKLPLANVPPVIARFEMPKPPILPPPFLNR
jgi:hypothetical protein